MFCKRYLTLLSPDEGLNVQRVYFLDRRRKPALDLDIYLAHFRWRLLGRRDWLRLPQSSHGSMKFLGHVAVGLSCVGHDN